MKEHVFSVHNSIKQGLVATAALKLAGMQSSGSPVNICSSKLHENAAKVWSFMQKPVGTETCPVQNHLLVLWPREAGGAWANICGT